MDTKDTEKKVIDFTTMKTSTKCLLIASGCVLLAGILADIGLGWTSFCMFLIALGSGFLGGALLDDGK